MQPSEIEAQHLGTFWMLNLDEPLPAAPAPRIPAVFMRAGAEVAQELAQAMELDDQAPVLQRFARGCHCYIARVENRLVTYGWVTFDEEEIGELGLTVRLKAGEAYIWDCATLPAYRGLRLYPALLAHILSTLQSAGLKRVWIGADADNLPSQSGMILTGFSPVIDIVMTGALTMRRLRVRGHPGVPEQVVTDARHALFGDRERDGEAI